MQNPDRSEDERVLKGTGRSEKPEGLEEQKKKDQKEEKGKGEALVLEEDGEAVTL